MVYSRKHTCFKLVTEISSFENYHLAKWYIEHKYTLVQGRFLALLEKDVNILDF